MNNPIDDSILQYLDTNGDETGNSNANGNYSITSGEFFIPTPANKVMKLIRMIVYIEDVGSFDSGTYGNGLALTNGITITIQDEHGNIIKDLTGGKPIKQNGHWSRLCYDGDAKTYGQGNEYFPVRWTFEKSGKELVLINKQRLVVTCQDDLSGLVDHTFHIQGYYE